MTAVRQSTFSGLSSLRRIRLHHQRISLIQTGSFSGLENLEEIFISSNNLATFPHSAFQCRHWTTLTSM